MAGTARCRLASYGAWSIDAQADHFCPIVGNVALSVSELQSLAYDVHAHHLAPGSQKLLGDRARDVVSDVALVDGRHAPLQFSMSATPKKPNGTDS